MPFEKGYQKSPTAYKFPKGHKINLGRKASEKTKKQMSETAKRIGKGKWMIGKKRTKETNRKVSKNNARYWLGKKRPDMTGEKHPRWVNGQYKKKNERNDSLCQDWVKQVKKRDKGQCRINNKDCSGYCMVHHILSWRDFPELRYSINNGITLCQSHHPRKWVDEQRLIPTFQELVGSKELI